MDGQPQTPPAPAEPLPPPPGERVALPGPDTPPLAARRSRGPMIAAASALVVLLVIAVAALAGGGSDAGPGEAVPAPTATTGALSDDPSSPTPADPTSTSGGPVGDAGLPTTIAGLPRLSGKAGEAAEGFMRAYIGDEPRAVGLYGTLRRPAFLYVVFGDASDAEGLPLREFLELSAAGGKLEISGEVSTRTQGDVSVACASIDDPDLRFMCVAVDDDTFDLLMGFRDTASAGQLDAAIDAAG